MNSTINNEQRREDVHPIEKKKEAKYRMKIIRNRPNCGGTCTARVKRSQRSLTRNKVKQRIPHEPCMARSSCRNKVKTQQAVNYQHQTNTIEEY